MDRLYFRVDSKQVRRIISGDIIEKRIGIGNPLKETNLSEEEDEIFSSIPIYDLIRPLLYTRVIETPYRAVQE